MLPTVCVCYIEANEPEALERSLTTMTRYPWVKEAVVLHTDQDRLPTWVNHVEHVYKDYGHGFDRQPEAGGFDEVEARNHVLRLGRSTGCDWLLLIDADEFFLPCTFDPIADAHRSHKTSIFFECWHFFSPTQYLFWPDTLRSPLTKSAPRMHDAHIRAIKAESDLWFGQNPNHSFRDNLGNATAHCVPAHGPLDTVLCAPGMYHIHTHHMYDEKRQHYLATRTGSLPLRTVRSGLSVFPKAYLDAYVPTVQTKNTAYSQSSP